MNNQEKLILAKDQLMNEMQDRLINWDKSHDAAIDILEKNNLSVIAMQEVDQDLTTEQLNEYNAKRLAMWQEIIAKQKELIEAVQAKKDQVEEQLVQMGQKDKVVSSYISLQNNSAFVEKDY